MRKCYHQSLQIKDNLYCYIWQGMGNNCNTYIFTDILQGERPHVIIDPGQVLDELGEPCFDSLLNSMAKDGIRIEDIGLIINTHTHPDHCDATPLVIEKTQTKGSGVGEALVTISREEEEFRQTIEKKLYQILGAKEPQFEPFFYLSEGELILGEEGKLTFQILLTPGHSPGSVSLYCARNKVLITGDVLFYGSVGRTDFPGGDIALLGESVRKLSKLDVEWLLPGHSTEFGSIIQGKEKIEHNFRAVQMFFR